jgi:adenosylcobinamide kinase / adenosylcobinamide-phosphate guanylyltransferase
MSYFITGGERSGKSTFAQQLALSLNDHPVYLATARKWDRDFEKRIARHQAERDLRWTNIEIEVTISDVNVRERVVVLDCITLWLTNIFTDYKYDVPESLAFAKQELDKTLSIPNTWIIISNEIGMGVHAATEIGRKFVELQGWINQYLAASANDVYFMVSGIPMKIKPQMNSLK